jgi:hypothetical protein
LPRRFGYGAGRHGMVMLYHWESILSNSGKLIFGLFKRQFKRAVRGRRKLYHKIRRSIDAVLASLRSITDNKHIRLYDGIVRAVFLIKETDIHGRYKRENLCVLCGESS